MPRGTLRGILVSCVFSSESMSAYLGLFLSALGAATLLPLQSETVLVGLLLLGEHPLPTLLVVATCGNVLGSAINWVLGRFIERWRDKPWFPVAPIVLARAQARYQRYGYWSLLLSWMPLIGDPITLAAGIMREPLWRFLLIVFIAKGGRYLVLAAATLGLQS